MCIGLGIGKDFSSSALLADKRHGTIEAKLSVYKYSKQYPCTHACVGRVAFNARSV